MKFWQDKEKMVLLFIFAVALAFILGVFVGRVTMHTVYYLG